TRRRAPGSTYSLVGLTVKSRSSEQGMVALRLPSERRPCRLRRGPVPQHRMPGLELCASCARAADLPLRPRLAVKTGRCMFRVLVAEPVLARRRSRNGILRGYFYALYIKLFRLGAQGQSDAKVASAALAPEALEPEVEEKRSLARLLATALQRIDQTGIDVIAALDQDEYRERNRRFKRDLQAELGAEQLTSFKECSAQFRRSLAEESEQAAGPKAKKGVPAVETYAQRVLEVFRATCERAGEAVAAELLSDLVLLLPDAAPRSLLRRELLQLLDSLEAAVASASMRHLKAQSRTAVIAPAAASCGRRSTAGSEAPPPPMICQLEELPLSRAFRVGSGSEGQPSFLLALDAVLEAFAASKGDKAKPGLREQGLKQQMKQLDTNQAESLQQMQRHLIA
ncbi:unnamed protein product, partial [Polarella glacialis]